MPTSLAVELSLDLKDEIETLLSVFRDEYGRDCPSEYTFSNLYLFREVHGFRYFRDTLYPRIEGRTYDGTTYVMPLVPLRGIDVSELPSVLRGRACFYPVAEAELPYLVAGRFNWSAQPSDSDYIYATENLIDYRGRRLRKRKNLMNHLLAQHQILCRPLDSETLSDAHAILAAWMMDKGKADGEADEGPCLAALDHAAALKLDGHVFYADGQAAGFILVQKLVDEVQVVRFAKGSDRYKGIYPYMFHHFCKSLSSLTKFINFEQDMGLENFRRSKLSYDPKYLLPKYRVVVKDA